MSFYDKLKKIVKRVLEAKETITLSQIMRELKLAYTKATKLLTRFNKEETEVRLQVAERKENILQWDRFNIPTKTVATYEVSKKLPLPPVPPEPPPVPFRFEALGLRVDAYTEEELTKLGKERLGIDAEAMKEMLEWWEFTGELEKRDRPEVFPPTYPEVVYIPRIEQEQKLEPPKRRWDILELRSYLQDTLGISMRGAMMAEWELRDGIKYVRLRTYRVPYEIATSFGMVAEVEPPRRVMGILSWMSHSGEKSKDYKYTHEINIYFRVPQDLNPREIRILFKRELQNVLDEIAYPSIKDILGAWHDADVFVTDTEDEEGDGSWVQLYEGTVQRSGEIPEETLKEIYRESEVIS